MSFHDFTPPKAGSSNVIQPLEIRAGVLQAVKNKALYLKLQIGERVARKACLTEGDAVAVKLGSGNDLGKMRIIKVAHSPIKVKGRKGSKTLIITLRGLPLKEKCDTQTVMWEYTDTNSPPYLQVNYPSALDPADPQSRRAPEGAETVRNQPGRGASDAAKALAAATRTMAERKK